MYNLPLSIVAIPETECQTERRIASATAIPDIYVPSCDGEGNFMATQCFEHSAYGKQCWCVDSSGQEIKGTRTREGVEPKCGKLLGYTTFFFPPDNSLPEFDYFSPL